MERKLFASWLALPFRDPFSNEAGYQMADMQSSFGHITITMSITTSDLLMHTVSVIRRIFPYHFHFVWMSSRHIQPPHLFCNTVQYSATNISTTRTSRETRFVLHNALFSSSKSGYYFLEIYLVVAMQRISFIGATDTAYLAVWCQIGGGTLWGFGL